MPLIKMLTSVKAGDEKKKTLAKKLSKICADCTGKPEMYVASLVEDDAVIAFAGEIKDSAFLEVRGIGGLTPDVNKKLSAEICKCLKSELGIDPGAVYINFIEFSAKNWGWNSSTFG
jgi:phenylpyruvate tautomerase